MSKYLVLSIALLVLALTPSTLLAQGPVKPGSPGQGPTRPGWPGQPSQPDQPRLAVKGPKEAGAKEVVTYSLKILKFPAPRISKIDWEVIGGIILDGQGSEKIRVKPGGPQITVRAIAYSLDGSVTRMSYATAVTDWRPNMPPAVSASAEITEIILACPDDGAPCEPTINPVVPLTVVAFDPDNDPLLYTWSAEGRIVGEGSERMWDLSGLTAGDHVATVLVDDANGGTVSASVTVSVTKCNTCTRPDPTAIVGVIKDSAGKNLTNAKVKATRSGGGKPAYGLSGSDGRYSIRYLKTGDYSVTASEACCKKDTKTTNLRSAGDQVLVDFALDKKQ